MVQPYLSLKFFLVISILWHVLQFVIFSTLFKVDLTGSQAGAAQTLQISSIVPIKSVEVLNNEPSIRFKNVQPNQVKEAQFLVFQHKDFAVEPKTYETERVKSFYRINRDSSFEKHTKKLVLPNVTELKSQKDAPFTFKGAIQRRKLISAPPLPSYPKWALIAGVELKLILTLQVNAQGRVHIVYVKESSGDGKTDQIAVHYAEKLQFEPSMQRSKGDMLWEFKLKTY